MWIAKSLTLSSFLIEQLETWISKFCLELMIRWLFSAFDILLLWNHLKNFLGVFLKFKNDKIKVSWTGMCSIICIMSNINAHIFKKEVTDVNVKKMWSQYETPRYTKKNLSKFTVRGIYFGSLFLYLEVWINKVKRIFINTIYIKLCYYSWSI